MPYRLPWTNERLAARTNNLIFIWILDNSSRLDFNCEIRWSSLHLCSCKTFHDICDGRLQIWRVFECGSTFLSVASTSTIARALSWVAHLWRRHQATCYLTESASIVIVSIFSGYLDSGHYFFPLIEAIGNGTNHGRRMDVSPVGNRTLCTLPEPSP